MHIPTYNGYTQKLMQVSGQLDLHSETLALKKGRREDTKS